MQNKRINYNLDSMITGCFGLLMFFGIQLIWEDITTLSVFLGLTVSTPFIFLALHSIKVRTNSATKKARHDFKK